MDGLFWFRRDLRLVDNVGLHSMRESCDRLVGVYVVDPRHDRWPHASGDRLAFRLEAVGDLRARIRDLGGELIVRTGDQPEVVGELVQQVGIDRVGWNRAYEPYERNRDTRVRTRLEALGVDVRTFKDQVMFDRDEILTNKGTPYEVFTYYGKKWKQKEKPEPRPAVERLVRPPSLDPGSIPTAEDLGREPRLESHPFQPTREAALNRWQDFSDRVIRDYHDRRDRPAVDGTSRLSPYLRFGLVSVRELYRDCRQLGYDPGQEDEDTESGIETYVEELIWRDFYHQVLYHHPHAATDNLYRMYDDVAWEVHPEWFEAWKQGRTGFPLVDAAMRQLNQIGWMHNRLRMVVAQFLTKHCLIHWRRGEKYFMNRLLDGDTAANNGGWQWSASTGTDAAPYFRVFNPVRQSERFDPEGEFIKQYCPALEPLDAKFIHAPWNHREQLSAAGIKLGSDYPEPILDQDERRDHAVEVFERVR